ncbi:MAG: hypothetical protein AVDCRST_MAG85-4159 [uncultured Solirubrobacteraceae bacterium]|uniref:Uncharacterized protein n=1 Tax=uncultured Solirubrobacteraceae bacterium TaxID=1162706 RepID=A0A6J4U0I2_9ACTN|nr:MAG: hypothetical protein AVDCRST_MAG85-4159 [uncultured Solirubrobacteraceae bacterium]
MIHTTFQPDQLQDVIKQFATSSMLRELRLFTHGIVNPEVFHARIDLRH